MFDNHENTTNLQYYPSPKYSLLSKFGQCGSDITNGVRLILYANILYAILQCVTFLERKKRSSWYKSLAIFIYKKYLAIKFDALFCGNPFYLRFSVLLFFYVGFLHWCLINSQINTALQMTSLYKLICQVLVYHSFHKSFVSELIRNGDLPISY